MFPVQGPYYMSYTPTNQMISPYPNQYGNIPTNTNGNYTYQQQHSQYIAPLSQNSQAAIETVHLYVPNTVIGAIIGTKGLFIKSITTNSNASVKVIDDFFEYFI